MGETEFHSGCLLCNRAWVALLLRKHSYSSRWVGLSIQGISGNYNSDTRSGLFQFGECQITLLPYGNWKQARLRQVCPPAWAVPACTDEVVIIASFFAKIMTNMLFSHPMFIYYISEFLILSFS